MMIEHMQRLSRGKARQGKAGRGSGKCDRLERKHYSPIQVFTQGISNGLGDPVHEDEEPCVDYVPSRNIAA